MARVYEAWCLGGDFLQRVIAFPVYGYRLEEAPDVHMWVQLAWCHHCQKVVHAEWLLSPSEAEERVEGSTNRHVRRDAERYRAMLVSRQSPPRCLHCGGTDIIPASGQGSERTLPHPVCGNNITFRHSGFIRLGSDETNLYSSEGHHLTTVPSTLIPGRGYGKER